MTEYHVTKERLSDDSFWLEHLGGLWCYILSLGKFGLEGGGDLERSKYSVGLFKLTCPLNIHVEIFRRQVNR